MTAALVHPATRTAEASATGPAGPALGLARPEDRAAVARARTAVLRRQTAPDSAGPARGDRASAALERTGPTGERTGPAERDRPPARESTGAATGRTRVPGTAALRVHGRGTAPGTHRSGRAGQRRYRWQAVEPGTGTVPGVRRSRRHRSRRGRVARQRHRSAAPRRRRRDAPRRGRPGRHQHRRTRRHGTAAAPVAAGGRAVAAAAGVAATRSTARAAGAGTSAAATTDRYLFRPAVRLATRLTRQIRHLERVQLGRRRLVGLPQLLHLVDGFLVRGVHPLLRRRGLRVGDPGRVLLLHDRVGGDGRVAEACDAQRRRLEARLLGVPLDRVEVLGRDLRHAGLRGAQGLAGLHHGVARALRVLTDHGRRLVQVTGPRLEVLGGRPLPLDLRHVGCQCLAELVQDAPGGLELVATTGHLGRIAAGHHQLELGMSQPFEVRSTCHQLLPVPTKRTHTPIISTCRSPPARPGRRPRSSRPP